MSDDGTAAPTWELWDRRPGDYVSLAPYVSAATVAGLGLAPDTRGLPDGDWPTYDRMLAERLYERLRAEELDPALEPWIGGGHRQQIRHPWLVLDEGWGNCLDLSIAFASMCAAAHLGTLLAVTSRHAFVVVTPARLHTRDAMEPHPLLGPDRTGGGGHVTDCSRLTAAFDSGEATPIDCLTATKPRGGFDQAVSVARADAEAKDWVHLVDLPWLHTRKDFVPLVPPPPKTVQLFVPGDQRAFECYDSHSAIVGDLRQRNGVVALLGPQGQGKSTIAREIALGARLGAGWFLNASEPQTLLSSLTAADLAHRNRPGTGLEKPEREGYAGAALGRLADSPGRWVVVLDNADGDPGKLDASIPEPGDDQLVLITTINPAWSEVPGVEVVELPAIEERRVKDELGAPLAGVAGGSALLLHAFRRLLLATGADADAIARDAASLTPAPAPPREPGVPSPDMRGPTALWNAIRDAGGIDATTRELGLVCAYLPPDHQPLELLRRLVPGADAAKTLSDHGLLTFEEETGTVRMHRLFGAAVRADYDEREPGARARVATALVSDPVSFALLDRHADPITVTVLEESLAGIEDYVEASDVEVGTALHALARLLELHGHTERSGQTFERASEHLEDPQMVADCLQGQARTVNQHRAEDEAALREAVEWAREAEELSDQTQSGRYLAMRGLLMKKLARFPNDGETELELLEEALAVLDEADRRREQAIPDEEHPERARSRFNLAGIRVHLAQLDRASAARHLDEAERIYDDVRKLREKIYGRKVHPHVAACVKGLGLVAYYRALLLPATPSMRSRRLREATAFVSEALSSRAAQEGSVDGVECRKDARLLAKIALARHAPPQMSLDRVRGAADEAARELSFAAVPPLPPDGRGLDPAIGSWARSGALRALVTAFDEGGPGEQPEKLGPLLEWLDEFSDRWDYRGGKERNLVAAEDFGPGRSRLIVETAHALGLIGTQDPPVAHYDHVLILGGLARACFARPLHAAKLIREGTITAGQVTALGGYRPLRGDELELAAKLGIDELGDELGAMDAGTRAAFGLGEPRSSDGEASDVEGASWRVLEYAGPDGLPVKVVAAHSYADEPRRANTADTYRWFATELGDLKPGQRVLLVTTDIYIRFQHADALRMLALPHGVSVDAVGIRPGDLDERLTQEFAPHHYLQETRSTIRALRALHAAATEKRD